MKIKSMEVSGLFNKPEVVTYCFHDDLNILTGRNGSGKTTILKLAWFIMSGNIILALREINFLSCKIETSEYTCKIIRTGDLSCKVELEIDGITSNYEDEDDDDFGIMYAENQVGSFLKEKGSSIFFPTFRRIEGGFSMGTSGFPRRRARTGARVETDVNDVLASLSNKLSNAEHVFVAAISTSDIVELLLRRHANFSDKINAFQAQVSKSVIDKIKKHESNKNSKSSAETLLSETRAEIENIEEYRSSVMAPLEAIRILIEKLFKHSGIKFGERLSFGDAADAVNSEVLSAGEKQMLSFICYNAFYTDSIVFIDEPELSLHVDWQRQLYSILKKQNSNNQFIFATHSPFIYGKYPDKEVLIGMDRGD